MSDKDFTDDEDLKMDEPHEEDHDESEEHGTVVPDTHRGEGDDDGGS